MLAVLARTIPFVILFLSGSLLGLCEPIQIYLASHGEPIVNKPLEVEVYILDESGRVDAAFEGKKAVTFDIERQDTDTIPEGLPRELTFKKGKSRFFLDVSSGGSLVLSMSVEGIQSFAPLKLAFITKDIEAPYITSVLLEKENVIVLKFSETLEEESALDEHNYKVITNREEMFPTKLEYHKDYVVLFLSRNLEEDEEGYVEVEDITDTKGNPVESGEKSATFAGCDC